MMMGYVVDDGTCGGDDGIYDGVDGGGCIYDAIDYGIDGIYNMFAPQLPVCPAAAVFGEVSARSVLARPFLPVASPPIASPRASPRKRVAVKAGQARPEQTARSEETPPRAHGRIRPPEAGPQATPRLQHGCCGRDARESKASATCGPR